MSVVINAGVSIEGPNTALIDGTVSDPSRIAGIEMFDDQGNDLGPATVNSDGTWTFDAFFDPLLLLQAVATDTSGQQQKSDPFEIAADMPLPGQFTTLSFLIDEGEETGFAFGRGGRRLYAFDATAPNNQEQVDITGQGGPGIAYVGNQIGRETIENFRIGGPRHDTLNLADSGLQSLAQVLQHTTMNGGSATIHVDAQTTLTLQGVTKQQIVANGHDFVFTGGSAAG